MVCPANSTLTHFRLCGEIAPACEDGDRPTVVVTVSLNPATAGERVTDPTTGAFIQCGTVFTAEFEDGCWCTCPLPVTQADDPTQALQASGSTYTITITSNGVLCYQNTSFALDLEDATAATKDTFDCGECVPISALLPALPTTPATDVFCAAVADCFTPPSVTGPVAGVLTHNPQGVTGELGPSTTHNLIGAEADNIITPAANGGLLVDCDAVNSCVTETPAVVTTDGTATGVTQSGTSDHTIDITLLSGDADNVATVGADGGIYVGATDTNTTYDLTGIDPADGTVHLVGLDGTDDQVVVLSQDAGNDAALGTDGGILVDVCATVLAECPATAVDNGDGTFTITGNDQAAVIVPASPDLALTTDGTALGVTLAGLQNHTADITLLSTDLGQDAITGTDGGILVNVCAPLLAGAPPADGEQVRPIVANAAGDDCLTMRAATHCEVLRGDGWAEENNGDLVYTSADMAVVTDHTAQIPATTNTAVQIQIDEQIFTNTDDCEKIYEASAMVWQIFRTNPNADPNAQLYNNMDIYSILGVLVDGGPVDSTFVGEAFNAFMKPDRDFKTRDQISNSIVVPAGSVVAFRLSVEMTWAEADIQSWSSIAGNFKVTSLNHTQGNA